LKLNVNIHEVYRYYPFGLNMAALSDQAILKPENKFKYNDKELQHKEFSDGTGLEEYNYGVRIYDPQLGKWGVIDPLSDQMEMYSPYSYTLNNPIRLIDSNGMDVTETTDGVTYTGKDAIALFRLLQQMSGNTADNENE